MKHDNSIKVTINNHSVPSFGYSISEAGIFRFNWLGMVLKWVFARLPGNGDLTIDYQYQKREP